MLKEVQESLLNGEFGDARSYLDELDANGQTSIEELNQLNELAVWEFDEEDGWGYIELD